MLGRTGISVSAVAFGAGPVAGLMTGTDRDAQSATVARALEVGINWFDTAPGYGDGRSEANLGRVLAELGPKDIHVATKVRLPVDTPENAGDFVRRSVESSLERLGLTRVTLLQLHNGITSIRGREPASITPADVLGPVATVFARLREEGLIRHCGLTGTGDARALREVVRSGFFDTLQVPFNILNPSAGADTPADEGETDYGNISADCADREMGVFAIRVFAGGALLGQAPGAHTLRTPYFPLALYERDRRRAERLRARITIPLHELAVRFVLTHAAVSSAIIGFRSAEEISELAALPIDRPFRLDLAVPPEQ
jgi:L-galactose dehydrogenase/L-glyceraldehyde 3-phosphate reductase